MSTNTSPGQPKSYLEGPSALTDCAGAPAEGTARQRVANRWTAITVDCEDPVRLAEFWSALLSKPLSDEYDGPGWATVGCRRDAEPRLTFQAWSWSCKTR